jgi:hypothetical protein
VACKAKCISPERDDPVVVLEQALVQILLYYTLTYIRVNRHTEVVEKSVDCLVKKNTILWGVYLRSRYKVMARLVSDKPLKTAAIPFAETCLREDMCSIEAHVIANLCVHNWTSRYHARIITYSYLLTKISPLISRRK